MCTPDPLNCEQLTQCCRGRGSHRRGRCEPSPRWRARRRGSAAECAGTPWCSWTEDWVNTTRSTNLLSPLGGQFYLYSKQRWKYANLFTDKTSICIVYQLPRIESVERRHRHSAQPEDIGRDALPLLIIFVRIALTLIKYFSSPTILVIERVCGCGVELRVEPFRSIKKLSLWREVLIKLRDILRPNDPISYHTRK